jgi:hypothetical protein
MRQGETAEPPNLDSMPTRQRARHRLENGPYRKLGVLDDELRIALGEPGDQFAFGHGRVEQSPAVLNARRVVRPVLHAAMRPNWTSRSSLRFLR